MKKTELKKEYNDLKSQSLAVGKSTMHDDLEHIKDSYLAFRVPLYSESLRKSETNPPGKFMP